MVDKADKKTVNYSKGHENSNCGVCENFIPHKHQCTKVAGLIVAPMWCKLFKHRDGEQAKPHERAAL